MMNPAMQCNGSVALAVCPASAQLSFAFYAASYFSALRFYFYYFFSFGLSSKRKFVS